MMKHFVTLEFGVAKDLNDEDTELARAFKFYAFQSCFLKMTAGVSESSRLDALYCCLKGNALSRAAQVSISSCTELFSTCAVGILLWMVSCYKTLCA